LKNEILAVILVVLVAGSLGVGYLAGGQVNVKTTTSTSIITSTTTATSILTTATTSTQTSVTSALEGTPCATAANQTVAYNPLRVYQLSVPSKAVLCIAFTFPASANYSFIARLNWTSCNASETQCEGHLCYSADPCTGVNATATPTFVTVNGATVVDVTYNFTIGSNASNGLVWLDLGPCGPLSVVDIMVGPLPSSIPLPVAYPTSCYGGSQPIPWSDWTVLGVTNATVGYVPTG